MSYNPDILLYEYRKKCIDLINQRVLIANIGNSSQVNDLTIPPNCNGYGRIRHFKRKIDNCWVDDPLPIDPASNALGYKSQDLVLAQVFQLAACNFRCWYCFVPFELLNGIEECAECAKWFDCQELIDMYLEQDNKPYIIDLSGGNNEIVPEWVIVPPSVKTDFFVG